MKEEILDLYDDNFNRLDKTIVRRKDEIPDGMNIMMSYALIKNDDKYLIEQFTERNNYKFGIPGGHLNNGENAEEGLKRELKEELNIKDFEYKKIDTVKFPYNKYIFNVFLIENKIDIYKLKYQEDEVIDVKWLSKEEIIELINNDKIPRGYAFILTKYI